MNPFEQHALMQRQERRAVMAQAATSGTVQAEDGQVTPDDALRRMAQESRPGRKIASLKTPKEIVDLLNNPAALTWMRDNLTPDVALMVRALAEERIRSLTRKSREAFIRAVGERYLSAQSDVDLSAVNDAVEDEISELPMADRERVANLYDKAQRRVREGAKRG